MQFRFVSVVSKYLNFLYLHAMLLDTLQIAHIKTNKTSRSPLKPLSWEPEESLLKMAEYFLARLWQCQPYRVQQFRRFDCILIVAEWGELELRRVRMLAPLPSSVRPRRKQQHHMGNAYWTGDSKMKPQVSHHKTQEPKITNVDLFRSSLSFLSIRMLGLVKLCLCSSSGL
jgi:hypothetical protein